MVKSKLLWVDGAEDKYAMRTKVRSHCARLGHDQHTEDNSKDARHRGRKAAKKSSTCVTVSCFSANGASDDDLYTTENLGKQQFIGNLVTYCGNSDPFGSQPIKITPLVAHLLNFFVYVWSPAKCLSTNNRLENTLKGHVRDSIRKRCVATLRNETGATATVLLCSTILSRLSPSGQIEQERVTLKLKMIKQLKGFLGDGAQPEREKEDKLIWLSHALFINAVSEQNMDEAKSHGKALQTMMRNQTARYGLLAADLRIMWQVLAYEIYRAGISFTSSILDIHQWLPAVFRAHFPAVPNVLKPMHERSVKRLDPLLLGTPLESICSEMFTCYWFWSRRTFTDEGTIAMLSDWETLRYYYRQLHFLEYYLTARNLERIEPSPKLTGYWTTQACIAGSMLLCQITHVSDPCVNGKPYWPIGASMADALQRHLTKALSKPAIDQQYGSGLLLACWAGATWQFKTSDDRAAFSETFFFKSFARVARDMQLETWDEVAEILHGYCPGPIPEGQSATELPGLLMPQPIQI